MLSRAGAAFMGVSLGEREFMNDTNGLAHSNPNATPQIIATTKACRRHRDPLDYQRPYDSMRRYAELPALKYGCARTRHSCYRAMR